MDTEAFVLARAEICARLEERRVVERVEEPFHWTQLMGNSLWGTLRFALQNGGGRMLTGWAPRALLSVVAPALIGLVREKGLPFLGKKSIFERFSRFIPFLKSI